MNRFVASASLLLPLALVMALILGCEVGESSGEPDPAETSEPAPPPVAEPTPSPSVPPSQVPSPPAPQAGGSPGQLSPPANMQKLGEMLGQAAQAADEASAEGGDNCDRAYAGAVAMARALHQQMGSATNGEASLPPRDEFVTACRDLPEEVQQCMIVSYSIQNQEECQRVREQNAELMAHVREIMGRTARRAAGSQGGQGGQGAQ